MMRSAPSRDTVMRRPKYNLTSVWAVIYFYVTLDHSVRFSQRGDSSEVGLLLPVLLKVADSRSYKK